MQELTLRQQKFVQLYLQIGNASEAARKSGYKSRYPEKIASRLLLTPKIKNVVDKSRREMNDKSMVTFEDKVNLLWKIAQEDDSEKTDKIKAIEVMNKMQGHNAPDKVTSKQEVSIETKESVREARGLKKDL